MNTSSPEILKRKLRLIKKSFQHEGFMVTVGRLYTVFVDYLFDIVYGLDTCTKVELSELEIVGSNREKGFGYEPTRLVPLRKLFKEIKPMIPTETVLVDFGCGKGRVLLGTLTMGFHEVRGIEFAGELCKIARKNYVKYSSRKKNSTGYKIIESDVTDYHIQTDENIFFINNPFDEDIFGKVLHNIEGSLQRKHRDVLIIYHNHWTGYPQVLEQRSDFSRIKEISIYGYKFIIYSNLYQQDTLHTPERYIYRNVHSRVSQNSKK